MTTPPLPTGPLLTPGRLGVWVQEDPLASPQWAIEVISAITNLLRFYGDPTWELNTLPDRARDIGYFNARNYYLNPDLARQSSVGPLQDTIDNKALAGIDLSEQHQEELAALAGPTVSDEIRGIWSMSMTRGPVETSQVNRHGNVVIWDTRGGWPIEYLHGDGLEPDAFGLDPV